MDINEALSIIPRSIVSLISLFIATKILGKKQVSELSLFDYCIGISIGNFTAEMILVLENQLVNGVVAILTFGVLGYLISYLATKSIALRRYIFGVPTIIMEKGKLSYKALKKLNIDINDFLEQARNAGFFNIEELSYAIMEANGKISFLEKDEYQKPTKKDLKVRKNKSSLVSNIIIDGKLMEENIEATEQTPVWFITQLEKMGYTDYENILLATYSNNKINIYRKNEDLMPVNTLE